MIEVTLLPATSAVTATTSQVFDLVDLKTYAVCAQLSGSDVVGSIVLEGSVDNTTFVALDTIAVTASADKMFNRTTDGVRYVRTSWTYTSGTGNLEVKIGVKENIVTFP